MAAHSDRDASLSVFRDSELGRPADRLDYPDRISDCVDSGVGVLVFDALHGDRRYKRLPGKLFLRM
jgi:hypothetical protein